MKGILKAKVVGVGTEPAFDNDGNPIEIATTFGLGIDCKYFSANRNDVVDIGDGTFVQASYVITVKDMSFDATIIQLINSRNEIVCEKDVKSLEVLENIKRVKIVV